MLDLDHLTITKTKPKPKRKLATVKNRSRTNAADTDAINTNIITITTATIITNAAANISSSHMPNATYANRPTTKPSSSNIALPFTTSSPKQCTYKKLTCIQHCLWIYLILSFCLPKCKCPNVDRKCFHAHTYTHKHSISI